MPTFISYVSWTDQGIKNIKEAPGRLEIVKARIKELGGEVKDFYLTTGETDMVLICEAPDGEVVASLSLEAASNGNVRTKTVRAWNEKEFQKIVSKLP